MPKYLLEYPSVPEAIGRMLDELEILLKRHEISVEIGRGVCLAVSEAFTNALIHGNKGRPDRLIKLGIEVNESQIIADINDQGTGGVERVISKSPAEPMAESGRGVDLIRHFAASVDFAENTHGGLQVTMVFSRSGVKRQEHVTNS